MNSPMVNNISVPKAVRSKGSGALRWRRIRSLAHEAAQELESMAQSVTMGLMRGEPIGRGDPRVQSLMESLTTVTTHEEIKKLFPEREVPL